MSKLLVIFLSMVAAYCFSAVEKGKSGQFGIVIKGNPSGDYYTETWFDISPAGSIKRIDQKFLYESGYLTFGDEKFYIYSGINSVAQYNNHELAVSFVDVNNDGFKDMIISGTVLYTGMVDYETYDSEDVIFAYVYNANHGKHDLLFKKATFDLTVIDDSSQKWMDRYSSLDEYEVFRTLDEQKKCMADEFSKTQHQWHYANGFIGILKREHTEIDGLVASTNCFPRGAEGGSGSEEINP